MTSNLRSMLAGAAIALVLLLAGIAAFVWSGRYPIGADKPHLPLTLSVMETLRDRATESAAKSVVVPSLEDPTMIAAGAARYAGLCTGCHIAPGNPSSALREGLYPQPPNLPKDGIDNTAEAFWIIKHGIKMTAMPAWGKTQTDAQIWAMVAFLAKVKNMTPIQYAAAVAAGGGATK